MTDPGHNTDYEQAPTASDEGDVDAPDAVLADLPRASTGSVVTGDPGGRVAVRIWRALDGVQADVRLHWGLHLVISVLLGVVIAVEVLLVAAVGWLWAA